ncbi:MAG: ASPIC/UnbV domain-containing protein, partial [Planctomycetota bacterium]|nr:ASPIC/UnbV domain-containing protein [Planctomycetota bacterium]
RVSVRAGDAVQVFETKRGSGWLGSNDPRVHVGLGAYEGPVEVEVVWPSGARTTHAIAKTNQTVTLTLGD